MKKLLIISPYFPPVNAADMQRVRMSLPYFQEYGWDAEVVTVDGQHVDMVKDNLLLESIPPGIKLHKVKAFAKSWTSKVALGSIALRSMWYYRRAVNKLLKTTKFDLIYFSTTQFPVCILGAYWKKRFGVPYIIDMQDPWHSEYYQDKPKEQQPPKYWFSYRLNRSLEPLAMQQADGLISVSQSYIDTLKFRYPEVAGIPSAVITFGYSELDLAIASANAHNFPRLLQSGFKNIVYIGRGGLDMHKALTPLFMVLAKNKQRYAELKFYFIGTSYAPAGRGQHTIKPFAAQFGIFENVVEVTDRIPYYHVLATLQQADALFVPGSDDPAYTASKIYPYLLAQKPLLAIFHPESPAIDTLMEFGASHVYNFDDIDENEIIFFLKQVMDRQTETPSYNKKTLEKYSAREMTKRQCELFDSVLVNANH